MILKETKEKIEWYKRAFECEQKNSYGIESQNDMTNIHDREVNKKSKCNLLHNIINITKCAKTLLYFF